MHVTGPIVYLKFAGNAREALTFYGDVFGGAVELHTFADFGRSDGPSDAIAHGSLSGGSVALFAADVAGDEPSFRAEGLMLSLLGTSDAATLRSWFARLSDGGTVVEALTSRPWGASDGQVVDRYGVQWLIGFEAEDGDVP